MRIYSKFNDYYDSIQAWGQDPNLIYYRQSVSTSIDSHTNSSAIFGKDFELYHKMYRGYYRELPSSIEFEKFYIGFCGKIYPMIKIKMYKSYPLVGMVETCVSDTDGLFKHLIATDSKRMKPIIERWCTRSKKIMYGYSKDHFDKWFELKGSEKFLQYFIDNKIVCCTVRRVERVVQFVINPRLKELDFVRVYNPFDAYQEISMFLGGVLGNESAPMITIEDKYRIENHGFDKWSFRKMPTKSRK